MERCEKDGMEFQYLVTLSIYLVNAKDNFLFLQLSHILILGMQMGYKNKCLFDRHAVGGEYGASWKMVGPGTVSFTFTDKNNAVTTVDSRKLTDTLSGDIIFADMNSITLTL